LIDRDEIEALIAYLEKAAAEGEGADLGPDLAKQLLKALKGVASREKSAEPPIPDGNGDDSKKRDGS
jgi:hypothetical protein